MELKGSMDILVSDADLAHIRINLAPPVHEMGSSLQFKHHPKAAKFAPGNQARVVALKDAAAGFAVNQSVSMLRWRYVGTDESNVPLSSASNVLLRLPFPF